MTLYITINNKCHFNPDLSGEKSDFNVYKDFSVEDSFEMTCSS